MPAGIAASARVAAALAAVACSEASNDPAPAATEPEPVLIQDANNYRATGSLSIPNVVTASGADLEICWSELESDLLCHGVAPGSEIDNVGFLRISRFDRAEVEARIAADDLPQSAVDGYVEFPTSDGETCTKLSSFSFFETTIDLEKEYVASDDRNYLMLFTTGTNAGIGARSLLFLEPRADSEVRRVEARPGCGMLEFSADLASAEPLVVPEKGPWRIDWGDLVHNGLGNEVWVSSIDRALLAFYAERSLADIEARIFDLETSASELYEITLAGESVTELGFARETTTGAEFSGFERDQEGIWLFGLLCGTCKNPAPVLLSVIAPRAEGA
jgi:hypothetical protein